VLKDHHFFTVQDSVLNIGHRGARSHWTENTLKSFEIALDNDVDGIELDVIVTKDQQLMVYHDAYINPELSAFNDGSKIGKKKRIIYHNYTQQEIKEQFNISAHKHPEFKDQQRNPTTAMLSLDEFVEWLSSQKKIPLIFFEVKFDPKHLDWFPSKEFYLKLILNFIQSFPYPEKLILMSANHDFISALQGAHPEGLFALIHKKLFENAVNLARAHSAQIILPHYRLINAKKINEIKDLGKFVFPWTVNKSNLWKRLIQQKVNGIISDDPQGLNNCLKEL